MRECQQTSTQDTCGSSRSTRFSPHHGYATVWDRAYKHIVPSDSTIKNQIEAIRGNGETFRQRLGLYVRALEIAESGVELPEGTGEFGTNPWAHPSCIDSIVFSDKDLLNLYQTLKILARRLGVRRAVERPVHAAVLPATFAAFINVARIEGGDLRETAILHQRKALGITMNQIGERLMPNLRKLIFPHS